MLCGYGTLPIYLYCYLQSTRFTPIGPHPTELYPKMHARSHIALFDRRSTELCTGK